MNSFGWSVDASALWGLGIKITALLAVAAAIATFARRQPAAARHFVWQLALGSVLALTFVTPWAPPRTIAVKAGPNEIHWLQGPGMPSAWLANTPGQTAPERSVEDAKRVESGSPRSARAEGRVPAVASFLAVVWLLGCLTLLARTAIGHLVLLRLERAARPLEANEWHGLVGSAHPRTRLDRVRVAFSPAVGTPLTWGWPHAILLLPYQALSWPRPRLRAAVLHELAHVERGDYLSQQAAMIACAIYWFHPLIWLAASGLRSESERACDDRVLGQGTPADEYAATLLDVAVRARTHGRLDHAAIGMARRSQLEGRLLAVLDESRRRGSVPRRIAASAVTALGCLLVPFAGLVPQVVPAVAALSSAAFSKSDDAAPSVFERTVPSAPGGRLRLDLETGGTVEIHGWDRREVRVGAQLRGRDWRDTEVTVDREGGSVVVRSRQRDNSGSYSTSHRFEIQVPRRFDVSIRSAGGEVLIADVEGMLSGHTGGGDIRLDRDHGSARLTTGGGQILVTNSRLDGTVSTGGGTVHFSRVEGGLRGTSGGGPVVVADGEESGTDYSQESSTKPIRVGKDGGDVVLDEAPHGASVTTGGGAIHVGRAAGLVEASTGGGDITIGPVAGSVRAGTGSGNVRIVLDHARGEAQNVDVHAGTGHVVIEVPEGIDARIDFETAYTRSFGRASRIESAWDLERTMTTRWDASQGTPRRYVRAEGVLGNGRGLIRVRTVNGDIELRQTSGRR